MCDYTFCTCKSLQPPFIIEKVEFFEHHSFSSCSLSSFNIPDSVNKIGVCAFEYCKELLSVILLINLTIIDEYCSQLATVKIPNNVTVIGKYAFYFCIVFDNIFFPEKID